MEKRETGVGAYYFCGYSDELFSLIVEEESLG